MLQDSGGFLWFGTQNGLFRYNGYTLKPYGLYSGPSDRFASNFITSLCEGDDKNIWIGTFGGDLFRLDPQTEEYADFSNTLQNTDGPGSTAIRAIYRDDAGKLWIGTQNKGLGCLDPASGKLKYYKSSPDGMPRLSSDAVTSICRDKAGILWVGTTEGLNKYDPRSGSFLPHENRTNAPGHPEDNPITSLYADKAGVLWIVTGNGGLDRVDTASGEYLDNSFPELENLKVTAVCEDRSGRIWVGTYGSGVRMLDKDSGKFTRGFSQNMASRDYRVASLYADSSGNLWIGTEGSGIDRINTNLNFISYKNHENPDISFSDDVVLSICKDRSGVLWIGTANGGVNRFDRESSRITYYQHDPKDSGSISSNTVNSIYEDSHGTLWFGTIDGTLNRFEPASGTFSHYKINNVENPNAGDNGILKLLEGKDGTLWACAANGGLVRFDRSTGQFAQLTTNPQDPYAISSNHVLSIAEDEAGILWVGTGVGGLNRLDTATGRFTCYNLNESASAALAPNYNVNAIVNDNGWLWLATNEGLYKFDKASGAAVFMKDRQQTADVSVFGLLKDAGDNLWLSTPNGLIKYAVASDTFKKYDFDQGFQKSQYTPGAYFRSADGEMFFGETTGFSCFYADKIMENTHVPPVVITNFKIFDTPVKLSDTGKVSLTYKNNFISFEFAALDYANPAKNQYAYKLEGFDADWHYSGVRNYASYTNLDGGDYLLRVKASNSDGVWNEEGIGIRLIVTPPFWRTTWFILAAIVFASASVIVLVRIRVRSIKLKSLELERQVAERTKELYEVNERLHHSDEMKSNFLSVVSHEIRTPLSAMLGFTELIAGKIEKIILPNLDLKDKKIQKAAEKISRDLNIIISEGDRLSALIDNLLNISKIESGKMDWKNKRLDISELIRQSLLAMKPIIEKAGLEVHTDLETDLPEISGDWDMLTRVFINLISNAVKFTTKGFIKVCAKRSGAGILVSIEDTGAGIREDHLDRVFERFFRADSPPSGNIGDSNIGLGLYICKQIVEKHNGTIWVESQLGKGSIFYFTIFDSSPIKRTLES
jgi:signal transduction histidine kinase/ligand-binding sensor domain-containing protein